MLIIDFALATLVACTILTVDTNLLAVFTNIEAGLYIYIISNYTS